MSWDSSIDYRILDKLFKDLVLPKFSNKVTNIKVGGVETKHLYYHPNDYYVTVELLIIEVIINFEPISVNYNGLLSDLDTIVMSLGQHVGDYVVRYIML